MRYSHRIVQITIALTFATAVSVSAHAGISGDLAKKCRALMVKAHPSILFGRTGTAAAQRAYFAECVRREGNMQDTGQDNSPGEAR